MLEGAYGSSKGTRIKAYISPRRKLIPLFKSQGEETIFVLTGSGGNLYEVHGMHGLVVLIGWQIYEDIGTWRRP